MNWTGGRLNRYSRTNRKGPRNQRHQPVAKRRPIVKGSIYPSSLQKSIIAHSGNTHQQASAPVLSIVSGCDQISSYTSDYTYQSSTKLPVNERKPAIDEAHGSISASLQTRQHQSTQISFDNVRKDLLHRTDWLGTSVARPLHIDFTPIKERERIGRHRALSSTRKRKFRSNSLTVQDQNGIQEPSPTRTGIAQAVQGDDPFGFSVEDHTVQTLLSSQGGPSCGGLSSRGSVNHNRTWSAHSDKLENLIAKAGPTEPQLRPQDLGGYVQPSSNNCGMLPGLDEIRHFRRFDDIKALTPGQSHALPEDVAEPDTSMIDPQQVKQPGGDCSVSVSPYHIYRGRGSNLRIRPEGIWNSGVTGMICDELHPSSGREYISDAHGCAGQSDCLSHDATEPGTNSRLEKHKFTIDDQAFKPAHGDTDVLYSPDPVMMRHEAHDLSSDNSTLPIQPATPIPMYIPSLRLPSKDLPRSRLMHHSLHTGNTSPVKRSMYPRNSSDYFVDDHICSSTDILRSSPPIAMTRSHETCNSTTDNSERWMRNTFGVEFGVMQHEFFSSFTPRAPARNISRFFRPQSPLHAHRPLSSVGFPTTSIDIDPGRWPSSSISIDQSRLTKHDHYPRNSKADDAAVFQCGVSRLNRYPVNENHIQSVGSETMSSSRRILKPRLRPQRFSRPSTPAQRMSLC